MVNRYEGFSDRIKEKTGAEVPLLRCRQYEQSTAGEVIEQYINNTPATERADAVFCENDILALGVIDTLKYKLGIQVPEEIAVIGFDNISLAANSAYNITTFEQPIGRMVAIAIGQMNHWLDQYDQVTSVKLPGQLIVRQSS